jgi:hypothetical protein
MAKIYVVRQGWILMRLKHSHGHHFNGFNCRENDFITQPFSVCTFEKVGQIRKKLFHL